jgi:replicative DNA helicase
VSGEATRQTSTRQDRPDGARRRTAESAPSELPTGLPPQDLEAEEAVLGAMMLNEQVIDAVTQMGLNDDDFYRPSHRIIFRTILQLNEREAVDQLTLVASLRHHGLLDEVGGQVAILELAENVPSIANARHYAGIVRQQSVLRGLVRAGTDIARLGYEHPDTPERLLDHAEQMVFDLGQQRGKRDFVKAADLLPEIYEEISTRAEEGVSPTGVMSGFRDLDNITGGFQPSNLIIVGARPAMGKTSWALNVAEHVALREKKAVAVFSLEMSQKELATRIMCSVGKVDQYKVKVGKPGAEDWTRLMDAVRQLNEARDRLFIHDGSALTPMELRSKVRRLHARHDLGLVVIDSRPRHGRAGCCTFAAVAWRRTAPGQAPGVERSA